MPTNFSLIKINYFPKIFPQKLLIFRVCRTHIAIAGKLEVVIINSWK